MKSRDVADLLARVPRQAVSWYVAPEQVALYQQFVAGELCIGEVAQFASSIRSIETVCIDGKSKWWIRDPFDRLRARAESHPGHLPDGW